MLLKQKIKNSLQEIINQYDVDIEPIVEFPAGLDHGDFTTNIAMVLSGIIKKNPILIAEEIMSKLKLMSGSLAEVERIEVVKPGFINFWLSETYLYSELSGLEANDQFFVDTVITNKRVLIEYAHPNTHKEMHIGHMRTLITGESLARIFTAGGAIVFRANYQGDIGPHVAKALYGVKHMIEEKKITLSDLDNLNNRDKAHFLGEGYIRGNIDYDAHKDEIDLINKGLYEGNSAIMPMYTITRQWSLDYYDDFYKRFYTCFDRCFFESEMVNCGREIVEKNIGSIFKKENGAVVFPGEKYGLHTRVFITQGGYPTYEGKEMCNGFTEQEAFPFDKKIHIVASEQAGYFKVVFKALELISPEKFKDKQCHVSMGMVHLSDRKMSSRTGDILTVDWLIDQVREMISKFVSSGERVSIEDIDSTVEKITIGAIKYSVLYVNTGQDVAFNIDKSVSLEGNSGPYLQYTYARIQSVLRKSGEMEYDLTKMPYNLSFVKEEKELLRLLIRYKDIIGEAVEKYAPNIIAGYLYNLAKIYNLFYQKLPILKESEVVRNFRLALTRASGNVAKSGLYLLGIQVVDHM